MEHEFVIFIIWASQYKNKMDESKTFLNILFDESYEYNLVQIIIVCLGSNTDLSLSKIRDKYCKSVYTVCT